MQRSTIILLSVLALLVIGGGTVAVVNMTRGIRNNNPGNIRHGDKWQGMAAEQKDQAFITFTTPEYGIRAMARILRTYYSRGIVSVRQMISTWAPPNENDTESYVLFVAKKLNVSPDATITQLDIVLPDLIAAIIRQENGVQPYSVTTINSGIALERKT